jgi:hypothetical protein
MWQTHRRNLLTLLIFPEKKLSMSSFMNVRGFLCERKEGGMRGENKQLTPPRSAPSSQGGETVWKKMKEAQRVQYTCSL